MKKFGELSGGLVGKQGLSFKQQGKIYLCCVEQFCCTVMKHGDLLLRMRQGCLGWSVA